MPIDYNKLQATVHLDRIRANYRHLQKLGGNAAPVVKSNAYGHGLGPVARVLAEAGASTLAVGSVEEAVRLRELPFTGRILCLLGPVDAGEQAALIEYDLVSLVFSIDQLAALEETGRRHSRRVRLALKFDTGMGRLGFRQAEVDVVAARLEESPHLAVEAVCSHLAVADDPEEEPYTREQARAFQLVVDRLRAAGYEFEASLANSGAVMAYPELCFDLQRPGIALYGGNPFAGTSWESLGKDMQPAMEITAPVLQIHELLEGHTISYGRTFTAPHDMRVAIVAAGYADAFSRGLSNKGEMLLRGRRVPIVGRVCMQMTAVDVSALDFVQAGDRTHLLGGEGESRITPEDLAGWWGTISYEVFCMLGLNPKQYTGE